jgi:hypothetical protein
LENANEEFGVEVNAGETHVPSSECRKNLSIKIANRLFKYLAKYKCFGMMLRNDNYTYQDIKK